MFDMPLRRILTQFPNLVLFGLALWLVSDFGLNIDAYLTKLPLVAIVGLAWWVVRVMQFSRAQQYRQMDDWSGPGKVLYWFVEPLLFVAFCILWLNEVPSRARFHWSEPALTRFARLSLPPGFNDQRQKVGSYDIEQTRRFADGTVRFITGQSGIFNKAGFCYSPKGPPTPTYLDTYDHLSGPWWVYHQRMP